MNRNTYYLPHPDIKSLSWVKSIKNLKSYSLSGSPLLHFLIIWSHTLKTKTRPIYYFRYLSDHESFTVNIIRIFSDLAIILSCFLLRGQCKWIMHNIDKETYVKYPKINKFRRSLIKAFSVRIYVTDPELIEIAKDALGKYSTKLSYTCFGVPDFKVKPSQFNITIQQDISKLKSINPDILVGLCATALVDKCFHLKKIIDLLNEANTNPCKLNLALVVVANFKDGPKEFKPLLDKISKRGDVLLYPEGGKVNENYLSKSVNFIYRSLSDISVPYSVYNAAVAGLPILTYNVGFTSKLVSNNKLGYVIDASGVFDFSSFHSFILNWKTANADCFLNSRGWGFGMEQLIN